MTRRTASTSAKLQFLLACVVLLAWLGFLVYQVVFTANPEIVSRPQVLAAPLIVDVSLAEDTPVVESVLKGDGVLAGQKIIVEDLPEDLPQSSGRVILVLEPAGRKTYRVYRGPLTIRQRRDAPPSPPVAYGSTDFVRGQIRAIIEENE